jgi:hypothetical protein
MSIGALIRRYYEASRMDRRMTDLSTEHLIQVLDASRKEDEPR